MPGLDATPIRLTIRDLVVSGQLGTTAAARDLIAQLPLTLTFRDLNHVEKYADLPRSLSMEGVPKGDDPEPTDIGYYAPGRNLVFYYGDVGYWDGIVRIGSFDGGVESIASLSGDFVATIASAVFITDTDTS
jgi:hypothetical protein